tara:strand:- start:26 stop:166 length:141 start_codon:yes stop_codon:yes gene_type:complete
MTYKKFLEKIETLVISGILNTKEKKARKRLKDIAELIVMFRITREK